MRNIVKTVDHFFCAYGCQTEAIFLKWKYSAQLKQIKDYNIRLKLLFLVFVRPGRQVKSALITNVRDSINHEESKWSQWTND